jgi:5-methylthioadenosine/S-adenosylhomocysteine deaminase
MRVLSADWVLPVAAPPIRDGAVAIDGDRIAAIGTREELGEGERFEESVICPGFVNTHAHLEYATYAGFGDGLEFDRWLIVHMERKANLEDGDAVAIARLGAAESLRSGITTVADASFTGASAPACAELGLRAIVHLEVFGRSADAIAEQFEPKRERIADSLSDRVRLGISPHAPYTVTPELYAAALELGLPVQTHLAESAAEDEWLRFGTGSWTSHAHLLVDPPGESGIRVLARHGLLDRRIVAAHCVLVDDEEIELLAAHDVAVAHCPRSNALLGCGVAPVAALTAAGVRVGLGTDSPASTPSFDMFEEMRAAVLLARASERDPGALLAKDALELATLRAASALDLDDEVGSLAPGKRADLTVVSLAGSAYLPWEDPAGALVFGGTPERVELTLVDGEERYRKGGETWQRLRRDARSARRRLLSDLPQAQKT